MKDIKSYINEAMSIYSQKGQKKLYELVEEYWISYWLQTAKQNEDKFLDAIDKVCNNFDDTDDWDNEEEFKKLKEYVLSKEKNFKPSQLNTGLYEETHRFIKLNCNFVNKDKIKKMLGKKPE